MGIKLTTASFIERAQQVHGTRYDYTNSVYVGAMNKITVNCHVHGLFEQDAMDHMKGRGCAKCNERQPLTVNQFIERSNKRHDNKYTYEHVVYKNVTTKVAITCSIHGDFLQTPKDHMHKYGCPGCGGTRKITTTQFVERAVTVHNDAYSYDQTQIRGMNTDVVITCHIHGDFDQRPADHLNGAGCPVCGTQKQGGGYSETFFVQHPEVKEVPAQLYLITVNSAFCKIGVTKKQYVKQRFPGMKFTVASTVNLPLYEAYLKEQDILGKYQTSRYKTRDLQESHHTGWTECFPLSMLPILQAEFERV